jgi:pimeloyl-ACP methyl ester carboxylesterase
MQEGLMEEKTIESRGIHVHYTLRGKGETIVLLHGYLESGRIWDSYAEHLQDRFRVLSVDLPGHGASGVWGTTHSMDDLATVVKEVTDAEGLEKIILAGHSMGGYVTMAFADLYPGRLQGYVLFHSTCFSDNQEKKENRDREISLVLCGKKHQIINVNIPKAFADENLRSMKKEVALARKIALQNPDQGIIALLNGMKERPDRSAVLSDPKVPLLLIGGMKDNYISAEVFDRLVYIAPHASVLRLGHSGHMGFMEEPALAATALSDFALRVKK